MPLASDKFKSFRLPMLQRVLPISGAQITAEIIAGITLAALAIPEVMGTPRSPAHR
jgi:MFS superfamily sulfate permease-like transporter